MDFGNVSIFFKCLNFIVPWWSLGRNCWIIQIWHRALDKICCKKYEIVKLTATWVKYHAKLKFEPVILCKNVVKCSVFLGENLSYCSFLENFWWPLKRTYPSAMAVHTHWGFQLYWQCWLHGNRVGLGIGLISSDRNINLISSLYSKH